MSDRTVLPSSARASQMFRQPWFLRSLALVAALALGVSIAAVQPSVDMSFRWAVYLVLGMGAVVGATGYAVREGRPLAAGGLMIAASPVALVALSSTNPHGLFSVGIAGGTVVFLIALHDGDGHRVVTIGEGVAGGVVGVFGVTAWWLSSDPRRDAPAPSWVDVMNSTGDQIDGAVATLGHGFVAMSDGAVLLWWGAVGVLVGAALLSRRPRVALIFPAALVVYTLVAWAIRTQRGPLDGSGGLWLIVGAIAAIGALVRLPLAVERRISVGLAGVAAALSVWAVNSLRNAQQAPSASAGWVVLCAVAAAVLVGLAWRNQTTARSD